MTETHSTLYQVRAEATGMPGEALDTLTDELGDELICYNDVDLNFTRLELYAATEPEAQRRSAELQARLSALDNTRTWTFSITPLPDRNWQEAWKVHFHVEQVSARIIVKPTWEPCTPGPGVCVVEIDPGLSFGTGQHATTRACLRFIDASTLARPGASLIDLGCGSGILAIAAAKLGCAPVLALDNDPVAVRVARENCALNGVQNRVEAFEADLGAFQPGRTFDVVVANIVSGVLQEYAGRIAQWIDPGAHGTAILAGILATQQHDVSLAFEAAGLSVREVMAEGEWVALRLGWRNPCAGETACPDHQTPGRKETA